MTLLSQRITLLLLVLYVFQMLFELEGYEDDLDYRSIPLSSKTPCSEAVPLILKKFNLPGEDCDYLLVEVSEENEGNVCYSFPHMY